MAEDENTSESHAEVSLVGKKLIVTPKSVGNHFFTLVAESNGRPVSKMVEVKVGDVASGIINVASESKSIICDGHRVYLHGFNGEKFAVYDISGRIVKSFRVDADNYAFDFSGHSGVYVLKSESNYCSKVIIK